jgi:hypothetical protein
MPGAPAFLQDLRGDPFAIITHIYAKNTLLISNFSFDLRCLCVLERIPQQFAGDSVNLILQQWL